MPEERAAAVTMRGSPLTLIGPELGPGTQAPRVKLLNNALQEIELGGPGAVRMISVLPSLDTPVCDAQTKRFNEEAIKLSDSIEVITVSADLPFAQARWTRDNAANAVTFLSDHRALAFGDAFGTHVKELRLDSRALFVIDKQGVIVHAEYVKEIAEHPDYDAALSAARKAAA